MTEELITQLSRLGNLKVISRTSVMQYKGTKKPLRQIAGELHVDAVVEGAVQLADNRVRITAQLVNGATDEHIWADRYDRDLSNVLLLQSDVASDIAKQIDLQLTPQQQQRLHASAHPVNPDAYQSYLLGRYYWNLRSGQGLALAGKYFGDAIQKDPKFALAYAGQADYFAYLTVLGGPEILKPSDAMAQARAAAAKALQLDDSLAEAHAAMGNILHNYDWNWDAAEREYKKAIDLNPNYAMAHHLYAHLLIETGRKEESLAEAHRALDLDPYSPFVNNGLARQYYLSRDYEKAAAQCLIGLQISPEYFPARIQLALAYEQTGKLPQAVSELEQAAGLMASGGAPKSAASPIDVPVVHALLAHAYAVSGRNADAIKELNKLQAAAAKRYIPPSYFAIVWMALGDNKQAFSWLNTGYKDRSEHMLYLGLEPLVDPLRSDPRFASLLNKVGLP
jgi:tetratricopeptide (TPR) repeat protein